jgi:hypothetical protein
MKKMKSRYPQPVNSDTFEFRMRDDSPSRAIVESIVVSSEICGHPLSFAAAKMLAADLGDFDEAAVRAALARCRMEVHGLLKLTDILAHIDDGRPTAEEAWALMPQSEQTTVVWTDEMAQASGAAARYLDEGDMVAARAAFDEAYVKAVVAARIRRDPVRWTPSLGSDVRKRESVLHDAVRKGRLSAAHVQNLLPPVEIPPVAEEAISLLNIRSLH